MYYARSRGETRPQAERHARPGARRPAGPARRATHVQEGTLARSLLSLAIEEADPEARNIVAVLDGIPGAYEHAMQSLERARAGETVALDEP